MHSLRNIFQTWQLTCVSLALLLSACQPSPQSQEATRNLPTTTAIVQRGTLRDPGLAASLTPTLPPTPMPSITPTPLPSLITIAKPNAALAAQQCYEKHGKIETQSIDTGKEGLSSFTVYLPPCYDPYTPHRYPVLYLLHGVNNDNLQWVRIGAPAAADEMILAGKIPPFLIVMPKEDNFSEDPDDSNFGDALVNLLVPRIDHQYATCTERNCRAIGGLSRGSGWAFRIGLLNWQTIGAIGAHSFSPFPGDLALISGWLALSSADQHPRIYIDIGTYDQAVPDAMAIAEKLSQMRVPHEWHLFTGAHNEDYWKAHIRDYLRWYAEAWK